MAPLTKSWIDEVHVLWISEGMSCDGDSVSVTAAPLLAPKALAVVAAGTCATPA